jgi:hypothetical protein
VMAEFVPARGDVAGLNDAVESISLGLQQWLLNFYQAQNLQLETKSHASFYTLNGERQGYRCLTPHTVSEVALACLILALLGCE